MTDYDEQDLLQDDDAEGAEAPEADDAEQGEDRLAALQRELQASQATVAKLEREVKASIGRFQSAVSRLEAGRGDPDALKREVEAQFSEVRGALSAILEDEAISPEVRERARAVAQTAKSEAAMRALQAELEQLKTAGRREDATTPAFDPAEFEASMVDLIEAADLDPDDPVWDWKGNATRALLEGGVAGGRAYFRSKIAEVKASRQAGERRQARKQTAGKGPDPAGGSTSQLDPSRGKEANLKALVDMGVVSLA